MTELGDEIIKAARTRIDARFVHHFRPENFCEGGEVTIDKCMQTGLGPKAYDCSGFVVASLCDVLDISAEDWPRDYRHLNQIKHLGRRAMPNPGDVLFFDPHLSDKDHFGGHMGISVAGQVVIHANGKTKKVEEGIPAGNFTNITILPIETLAGLAKN